MFRQLSTIGYLFHFPSSYSLPLTLALGCWRIRIPPLAAYQMTLYKIYPVNIRSGESRIRRKRNRQQPGGGRGGGGGGESLKLLAKGWLQWLQEGDRRAEREGSYMNNARRRFVGLWGAWAGWIFERSYSNFGGIEVALLIMALQNLLENAWLLP